MRGIMALIRVSWLNFTSYRMNVVFSALSLVALFVPLYFVANALQPVVAESIADEGENYFGFLITGMAVMQILSVTMQGLPGAVSGGIRSGTLEALFATPTPLPELLLGMVGYGLLWSTFKAVLLLVGLVFVGGSVSIAGVPLAALALVLMVLAHLPVGIFAASMILVFRTAGPLVTGVIAASSLLGGVYYSTDVIPEIVRPLASFVPLTYGLRAFRRSLLSDAPWAVILGDIGVLSVFVVALLAVSMLVFGYSLRYAQRAGSLSQY